MGLDNGRLMELGNKLWRFQKGGTLNRMLPNRELAEVQMGAHLHHGSRKPGIRHGWWDSVM